MQRRAFLKQTALGGAALVAPAFAQEVPLAEENASPAQSGAASGTARGSAQP
ncbi:ABC transporter substrate-binding protein, partial [Achromobacter xylosoxidans]